jgi:hemerythrin superfamily protein
MTSQSHPAATSKTANRINGTDDAIALLVADHENVKMLFEQFEELADKDDVRGKQQIAQQICDELTIHAKIEEEIFYPAARAAIKDDDMLNEAEVEHASAKDLIAQIQDMSPEDDMYDAKVKVLSEYINHHVKEEEGEMFPKCKKSSMDLVGLAAQLTERKDELVTAVA